MARSLYVRLALALVAAVPTTLLYLSTVLDLPFHLLDHLKTISLDGYIRRSSSIEQTDKYNDEAAEVIVDGVLYAASVVYATMCLIFWTWVTSRRQLARQLFAPPGLGAHAAGQLSFFFLAILPVVLVAVQVVEDATRYHNLFVDGQVTLNALLAVGFDVIIAFTACIQLWYSVALQLQLHSFEVGQDRQRYTRKIYFLYSPSASSTPSLSSSSSPSTSDEENDASLSDDGNGVELNTNESHIHPAKLVDDDNRARRKAYELSMDPVYAGFTKSVMSMDEFNPNALVREGAIAVVMVIDPFTFTQGVCQDELTKWLSEEAGCRSAESADVGPMKNIVYTPEGTRRMAFLRVKYSLYVVLPENSATLTAPPADVPRYIDEWLSQFGAHRLLPLSLGETDDHFNKWKTDIGHKLVSSVVNPNARSPFARRTLREPYMGWFDFLRWLDTCSDPSCATYHRYEVEKLRERPSPYLKPRFVDYVWWFLTSARGRVQLERRYEIFSKANCRLVVGICLLVATSLAIFLPLRLHYYTDINEATYVTCFSGLSCLSYFLWTIVAQWIHSFHKKRSNRKKLATASASLSYTDRIDLNASTPEKETDNETSRLLDEYESPSSETVLPAKYHFHTNVDHYHQEVTDKEGGGAEAATYYNPYCPLSEPTPLLRVPYTCPLFDPNDSAKKTNDDSVYAFGSEGKPLFDEDFESHDELLPAVFGDERDGVKWRPSDCEPFAELRGVLDYEGKAKEVNNMQEETLIVNPMFYFQPKTCVPYFCFWNEELLHKHLAEEPIVILTMPGTSLPLPYQVSDFKERSEIEYQQHEQNPGIHDNSTIHSKNADELDRDRVENLVRLFYSLQPGLPPPRELIDSNTYLIQKLIQSEILVTESYWRKREAYFLNQAQRAREELQTVGYTILKNLLPKRHVVFLRRFYRRLFHALGGQPTADKLKMQKCQWNDEPASRFINHYLTSMISNIVQEPALHPGVALSIWIMKGQGFPLHRDSVPPFDLTLDFVLDHVGPQPRPITFIRRRRGPLGRLLPGVEEMTLSLSVGEAVLFRGAEMPHFGGDLDAGNYHNVLLWTWSLVRD